MSAGQSGIGGPTGTGSSITDGTVTWTFAASGGWRALLNEPAVLDFQRMGSFLDAILWYELVPSGLAGRPTLVTAGYGHLCYVERYHLRERGHGLGRVSSRQRRHFALGLRSDAHTGSLAVALDASKRHSPSARWYDPSGGT